MTDLRRRYIQVYTILSLIKEVKILLHQIQKEALSQSEDLKKEDQFELFKEYE